MPSLIVVLGTHRSGSSCVAGMLSHLGVPMGDRLLPANAANPRGFFEDEDFLQLHREALGEVGPGGRIDASKWHDPRPDLQHAGRFARYRDLLARRAADHPVSGVKDPRLCYILPLLLRAAAAVPGLGLKFVQVHRPWEHAMVSLERRDGLDRTRARRVAHEYARQLAVAVQLAYPRGPMLTLDYDWTVDNPYTAAGLLADFVSAGIGAFAPDRVAAAARSIDPALRHVGAA